MRLAAADSLAFRTSRPKPSAPSISTWSERRRSFDLFDYKPGMKDWFDKDLPESIRKGQRLTTMTSGRRDSRSLRLSSSSRSTQVRRLYLRAAAWTAKMADDITIIRTLYTEAINHEPAITFIQTGNQIPASIIGSWIAYGLGSMNQDLPSFVVLNARHSNPRANVQAISARLWSAGFLSAQYSGVSLLVRVGIRCCLSTIPTESNRSVRRRMLDALGELNQNEMKKLGDPETQVRIAQYEMAFRMQASVPELTDLSKEPESTFALYGEDARKGGTFANSALMARRWSSAACDSYSFIIALGRARRSTGSAPEPVPRRRSGELRAGSDLKQRGMLDDTLVIGWRIRAYDRTLRRASSRRRIAAGSSSALFSL